MAWARDVQSISPPPVSPDHWRLLPVCDLSSIHPSTRASNPSNAEQNPGKPQHLSPGISRKVSGCSWGHWAHPTFLLCSPVMPFPSGRGSRSCCWISLHSSNPRKRCRIHWRESSHGNINSSCTALIQFAGKVNLSQNIPLFTQCLRNFPFPGFFKNHGPPGLPLAQPPSSPQILLQPCTSTTSLELVGCGTGGSAPIPAESTQSSLESLSRNPALPSFQV